jgi:hypothetical protein
MDVRKRLEKKMKKSSKIKEVDQNMIEEEMARIIPGKLDFSRTKRSF